MKKLFVFFLLIPAICIVNAQSRWHDSPEKYQRMRVLLNPYRPAPGLQNPEVRYTDIDGDGDPDILSTTTGGDWKSLYKLNKK